MPKKKPAAKTGAKKSAKPKTARTQPPVFQLKITLLDCHRAVWRRIQVADCTLAMLHRSIQDAMGWTESHLHAFDINGEQYSAPDFLEFGMEDVRDSTTVRLSKLAEAPGENVEFLYIYDFGDNWEHKVEIEGLVERAPGVRYPICVAGKGNSPPEDVGGVWGYREFLKIIANPRHQEHAHYIEWAGTFDPDEFDPEKTTRLMR